MTYSNNPEAKSTDDDSFSFFYNLFGNSTDDDIQNNNFGLEPAADVSVDAVMTSIYFNTIVFILLMATYELLRRLLPHVYSARKRLTQTQRHCRNLPPISNLPDEIPFDWVGPVFGVSWYQVRKRAGLDGYFYLRFIRACVRITLISSFWAGVILVPIYASGHRCDEAEINCEENSNNRAEKPEGWYYISMVNLRHNSWQVWVPTVYIYLFSAFVVFVMKQEYKHFMELRMDYLGRGQPNVHPQERYSLIVENIPVQLRSNRALFDYFNHLFPGKVHSANVVLDLPELEAAAVRCQRRCRRLEKSIAYYQATGVRPSHIVGRARLTCCGIGMAPMDCSCATNNDAVFVGKEDGQMLNPPRGTRVDSVSYYTQDLANANTCLFHLQQQMEKVAESGNAKGNALLDMLLRYANDTADQIMEDSLEDNELMSPSDSYSNLPELISQTPYVNFQETQQLPLAYQYGSFPANNEPAPAPAPTRAPSVGSFMKRHIVIPPALRRQNLDFLPPSARTPFGSSLLSARKEFAQRRNEGSIAKTVTWSSSAESDERSTPLVDEGQLRPYQPVRLESWRKFIAPGGRDKERSCVRRVVGRLGLDFVVAGLKFAKAQLEVALEGVVGRPMSSTGFVTFLELAPLTSAASTPLTHKPNVLEVSVAPEPREILWRNVHFSRKVQVRRENFVNILLVLGVFLWTIPLFIIQLFAKAQFIAKIPGLEWILTINGGAVSSLINGYLPVLALLTIILLLPVFFERVAIHYERRKTHSEIQRSIVNRYFLYQLANIFITVTAGSLWESLEDILKEPPKVIRFLGERLPTMVGYFVALLVTKILAGLPMIFLRFGALVRMLFLRALSSEKKLTQREVDEVYRDENVQYGWEFPSQLLVIVIVFTYATICPVILPFGALYFMGSLVVYKKQVLYVYTPVYESGGALFPDAVQRMLFGLVCGQVVFIGYVWVRGCTYQPLVLVPLPLATIWVMGYFNRHFAEPSRRLSLERAIECDHVSDILAAAASGSGPRDDSCTQTTVGAGLEARKKLFDKNAYRQPVLAQRPLEPMQYRRGEDLDVLTNMAREQLRRMDRNNNSYSNDLAPGVLTDDSVS